MPKQTRPAAQENATGIVKALKENKEAAQAVEKAADELAVVHAVLDSELPKDSISPDANQAVERASQIEKQLTASSEKLKEVNESLGRELSKGSP